MNKVVLGAFAFALATASPAIAQDHHGGGGGHGGSRHASGGHMGGRGAGHAPSAHASMHISGGHAEHRVSHHMTRHEERHLAHHVTRHEAHHVARHEAHHVARHEARHIVRHEARRAAVSNRRYANLRRAIRATHRFHLGVYRRPHGWYHRHWVVGAFVPRPWFVRDYWITDFGLYGLIAPPDGLVWVRVGPDALLIDPGTGEVVQVVYGIFW